MQQSSITAVVFVIVGLFVFAKAKTVVESHHVAVPEGEKLQIECVQHEGKGIKWTKTEGDMHFVVSDSVKDGKTVSHLTSKAVQMSDQGSYRCQTVDNATDGMNVIVSVFTFTVTMTPKLVVQIKMVATVVCDVSIATTTKQWFHGNENVQQMITDGNKHFEIMPENGTLKIINIDPSRIGVYSCRVDINDKIFLKSASLDSHPYIDNFDQSKNLVHGDPLTLNCSAWGHPEVTFAWYMNNRLLHADERISFGPKNMSLKIGSIEFSDRGDYTCVATNLHGSDNSTILIRVKDKLAALWPFLGICAEVVILCTIIFVYEKMRAKKRAQEDLAEEEERMTTANSNDHKGAEDIRQRK